MTFVAENPPFHP